MTAVVDAGPAPERVLREHLPRLSLLGPVTVTSADISRTLPPGRLSTLLALLALEAGRVVSTDRLMDQLWGDTAPPSGAAGLHVYVSRLRRVLSGTDVRVVRRPPGYLLEAPPLAVDVHLLTTGLAAAERAAADERWSETLEQSRLARALWRDRPFLDAHPCPDLAEEGERVARLARRVDELTVRALLALDRAGEAETLVAELCRCDRFNETYWRLRMRTAHQLGNDAAALAAYDEFRTVLADELGLDPSERMQRLQLEILRSGAHAGGDRGTGLPKPSGSHEPAAAAPEVPGAVWSTPGPAPTGRAAERAALERAVAGAVAGSGRTVVLEGEPGIGKSFLAAHAAGAARAAGARVVWARAGEGPGTPPWWLWEQVLDQLADEDASRDQRSGAATLRRLADLGAGEDADQARFRLCRALVAEVAGASRDRPLLVVLDDVQWADDATLHAVRLLAQEVPGLCCSLVLTVRTGAGRSPAVGATLASVGREASASRHCLAPFSEAEVLAYLDARAEAHRARSDVALLHRRSGGNPFFLDELLRAGSAGEAPQTATDLVRQRLAGLAGASRAVLDLAAVVGSTFSVPVVATALDRTPVDVVTLLEPAAAEGFVVVDAESGQWRFRHDLAREALLDPLPTSRRAQLHGSVADAVSALHADDLDQHVDELADHRFRAALGAPSAQAYEACSAAADRASRRMSYDQAALHRSRALICLPPGRGRPERFEVLLRLAQERRAAGDVVGASVSLRSAVELARLGADRTMLARALTVLGGVTLWNWRQLEQVDHDTVALLDDLLEHLPRPDPSGDDAPALLRQRVELLGTLAVELYYDDGRPRGEQHALEAVALARTSGDAALLGRALNNYVIAAWTPARDAERLAALDESLALTGPRLPLATEVVARLHRSSLRLAAADAVGFSDDLDRAERLAPRLGLLELEGQVTAQRAGLALLRGDTEAAEELVARTYSQLVRTSLWGAEWVRLVQLTTLARLERQPTRVLDALVAKASEDAYRPLRWTAVLVLSEAGEVEQARDLQARWGLQRLGRRHHWGSTFEWAQAAETALLLGAPDPAAVYAALAPHQERLVVAGTSLAVWGPAAALLARLATALGDAPAAAQHAGQAASVTSRLAAGLGFTPTWPGAAR